MPTYPVANVKTREPVTSGSPQMTPAARNVRPEIEYTSGPHDGRQLEPITQSDFNFEGKPDTHTNSRVQVATATNYASTLAIESEEFGVVSWARGQWTGTPSGAQMPWAERTNVQVPPAVAYGSLFSLPGVG